MLGATRTITLYHKGYNEAADEDTYTRFLISGVSVYDHPNVAASTSGLIANDSIIIRIPNDASTGNRNFAMPKAYSAAADKSVLWTIAPGDIIVLEETDREVDDAHPWASLESDFDAVCTVTGSRDRRDREIPHIIIEGK